MTKGEIRPYIIGLCGGSGSGKTTIAQRIRDQLGEKEVLIFDHDPYYRDLSHLRDEEREKVNFDCPEALDLDFFIYHLRELKSGRSIKKPVYDFVHHIRKEEVVEVFPKNVILVEGILVFVDQRLRDLMDLKVFIEVDADIRLIRRLTRDLFERGRSFEGVISQYLTNVYPMYKKFVEPLREYAELILNNNEEDEKETKKLLDRINTLVSY
ncbi:MAG: uridine kinase [Proteobacteria bacterium]|nr:uridine kinase [Pseudomonadota bacterium]